MDDLPQKPEEIAFETLHETVSWFSQTPDFQRQNITRPEGLAKDENCKQSLAFIG